MENNFIKNSLEEIKANEIVNVAQESYKDVKDVVDKNKTIFIWVLIISGVILGIIIILTIIYSLMR